MNSSRLSALGSRLLVRLVFIVLAGLTLLALGQEGPPEPGCPAEGTFPCLELKREDQIITVQQTATDAEGGIFGSRTFAPDDACEVLEAERSENRTLTTFYAPVPKVIETRIDDTLITASIVLRSQPEGDQDAATLDIFGGALEWNEDTFCPNIVARSDEPTVTLSEGRTAVTGVRLLYDNASGESVMTGSETSQVTLTRAAEGDSPALTASADKLEFGSDEDERTFTGGVRITSEDRVSEADTLVYNDETGVAVLHGDPATSRKGDEFVQGNVITYYLDSNDVVVVGQVSGEAVMDLGESDLGESEPAPASPPLEPPDARDR